MVQKENGQSQGQENAGSGEISDIGDIQLNDVLSKNWDRIKKHFNGKSNLADENAQCELIKLAAEELEENDHDENACKYLPLVEAMFKSPAQGCSPSHDVWEELETFLPDQAIAWK